jgi:hypothetical protein
MKHSQTDSLLHKQQEAHDSLCQRRTLGYVRQIFCIIFFCIFSYQVEINPSKMTMETSIGATQFDSREDL